jgi:hypothetical protein
MVSPIAPYSSVTQNVGRGACLAETWRLWAPLLHPRGLANITWASSLGEGGAGRILGWVL